MDQWEEITSRVENILSTMDTLTGFPELTNLPEKDNSLWKALLLRDFGLNDKVEETWQDEYEFQVRKNGNKMLLNAVENSNLRLIEFIFEKAELSDFDCNTALEKAIEDEKVSVITLLIDKMNEKNIEIDYDSAIVSAIKSGKAYMVERILQQARDSNFNYEPTIVLEEAAAKGNIDIFNLFNHQIQSGCFGILIRALEGGNIEIVQQLIDRVDVSTDPHRLVESAARGGNQEVLDFIISKTRQFSYERILIGAIDGRHLELITQTLDYVLKHDLPLDYSNIWEAIGITGRKDIMDIFIERELNPSPSALYGAVTLKRYDLLVILLNLLEGYFDYDDILLLAIENGDVPSTSLIFGEMSRKGLKPNYRAFLNDFGYDLESDMIKLLINDIIERGTIYDYKQWIFDITCQIIYQAAERGDQDTFKQSLRLAEDFEIVLDYNEIAARAAGQRHIEIMTIALDRLKEKDLPINYEKIMEEAVKSGSQKLIEILSN